MTYPTGPAAPATPALRAAAQPAAPTAAQPQPPLPASRRMRFGLMGAALMLLACGAARAVEPGPGAVYGGIGLPGLILGYAHPLNQRITLRGDVATSGQWSRELSEDGLAYEGSLRFNRLALLADYRISPLFRLTAGVTFNDMRVRLQARGTGQVVDIGQTAVALTPADRLQASVRMPRVTPYVGLGLGHHAPSKPGWNVVADVGLSVGKPKVTGSLSGPAAAAVPQSEVDDELRQLRDKVSSGFMPQLSVGASYRYY